VAERRSPPIIAPSRTQKNSVDDRFGGNLEAKSRWWLAGTPAFREIREHASGRGSSTGLGTCGSCAVSAATFLCSRTIKCGHHDPGCPPPLMAAADITVLTHGGTVPGVGGRDQPISRVEGSWDGPLALMHTKPACRVVRARLMAKTKSDRMLFRVILEG